MINIMLSSVKLVRESCHRYNIESRYIHCPADAVKVFNEVFALEYNAQEVVAAIYLDAKNRVIGVTEISRGSLTASILSPRQIYIAAILQNAAAVIISHNHPSGDAEPSNEDIKISHQLLEAGRIVDVKFLDHIVIGDKCHISLKEKGYLN